MRALVFAFGLAIGVMLSASVAAAWTAPSGTPPNNNVSAPINVSSTNQVKNGTIGVNGLAVFGNSLLGGSAGSNAYLNFGATAGTSGYGIWDNAGTLEFKNSGGSWSTLQNTIYSYCSGGGCGSSSIAWANITGKPYPVTSSQTWNWSGQSGQPSWLWGSNDGNNFYVWNPSNFSVSNAANLGGVPASSYVTNGSSPTFGDVYVNNWYRVNGSGGIYWQSYGGGWFMEDSTWIRSYGSKPVYMDTGFDTGSPSGVGCGGGLGGGYTFRVCGNEAITGDSYVGARGMWMSETARKDGGQFWSQVDGNGQCPGGALMVGISGLDGSGYVQYILCQWIN